MARKWEKNKTRETSMQFGNLLKYPDSFDRWRGLVSHTNTSFQSRHATFVYYIFLNTTKSVGITLFLHVLIHVWAKFCSFTVPFNHFISSRTTNFAHHQPRLHQKVHQLARIDVYCVLSSLGTSSHFRYILRKKNVALVKVGRVESIFDWFLMRFGQCSSQLSLVYTHANDQKFRRNCFTRNGLVMILFNLWKCAVTFIF